MLRPSRRLAEDIVTHIERSAIDLDLARRQHESYVTALAEQLARARGPAGGRLPGLRLHRGEFEGLSLHT